jgi:hypothetical protein
VNRRYSSKKRKRETPSRDPSLRREKLGNCICMRVMAGRAQTAKRRNGNILIAQRSENPTANDKTPQVLIGERMRTRICCFLCRILVLFHTACLLHDSVYYFLLLWRCTWMVESGLGLDDTPFSFFYAIYTCLAKIGVGVWAREKRRAKEAWTLVDL